MRASLALVLLLLTSPAWGATGTPWSTLGVVADGQTDNTQALNNLPTDKPIIADCPAGSFVRFNGVWQLKSNLNIRWLPGCEMVSYGAVPFALEQRDLKTPISNVTLDGITIRKDQWRDTERFLRAWIDHFKLLNWSFLTPNDGGMFLRGSCQEIAHGRYFSTQFESGSPGIRHIGNMPKVTDKCEQIADVWVHSNHVISGDSAYQSCQPLQTSLWINVSSDDLLWEKNTGSGGTFLLVGAGGNYVDYSCTNITYRNIVGEGNHRGVLVSSAGPNNHIKNISFINIQMDASAANINSSFIHIRGDQMKDGDEPGNYSNLIFDNVSVYNTGVQAFAIDIPKTATLDGLVIRNGIFDAPRIPTSGGSWFSTISISGGSNIVMQNNIIRGKRTIGGNNVISVGHDNNSNDPKLVTNFTFIDNLVEQIPDNHAGLWLMNVANPLIKGNVIKRSPAPIGAPTQAAIRMTEAYRIQDGSAAPGTTDALITGNVMSDMASGIAWTCNGGSKSLATFNVGDEGHSCAPAEGARGTRR